LADVGVKVVTALLQVDGMDWFSRQCPSASTKAPGVWVLLLYQQQDLATFFSINASLGGGAAS